MTNAALGEAPTVSDAPPAWRRYLAYATVALMPLSFNIGPYLLASRKPLNVSPFDPLMGVLVLLLLWDILKGRVRGWGPPLANAVWALLALLSILWVGQGGWMAWGRSAVLKTALVGLFGVWVFRHIAPDAKTYRRLVLTLGASVGLCFLYALYQYVQPVGKPLPPGTTDLALAGGVSNVRLGGWYAFRGHLAGQVAMLVPACAAFAVLDKDPAVRVAAAALALLGLCICLSGGGVIAACAGTLAVAAALLAGGARPPEVSSGNGGLLAKARIGGEAAWQAALLAASLLLVAGVVLTKLPRRNHEVLWRTLTLYAPARGTNEGDQGQTEQTQKPTARLRRYQAALNALASRGRWKKGYGAGRYQDTVNQFYSAGPPYPKPGSRTDDEAQFDMEADEPMSFGLLETTAVELGLAGLLAMTWLFLAWASAALSAFVRTPWEEETGEGDAAARTLALSALGAAVGAMVFSLFGSPLVRGCGGSLALFMGLALALNTRAASR